MNKATVLTDRFGRALRGNDYDDRMTTITMSGVMAR